MPGHVSYPTDSPTAIRLKLCNSLVISCPLEKIVHYKVVACFSQITPRSHSVLPPLFLCNVMMYHSARCYLPIKCVCIPVTLSYAVCHMKYACLFGLYYWKQSRHDNMIPSSSSLASQYDTNLPRDHTLVTGMRVFQFFGWFPGGGVLVS